MNNLNEIVNHCEGLFVWDAFPDYPGAWNGLQVENSGKVSRIAAAVDASLHVIDAAARAGADLLVVHHGLYWGGLQTLTGVWRKKVGRLVEADMAVISVHLPLDAHPELGNNILLARALGLRSVEPFFETMGRHIGFRGELDVSREELIQRLERTTGSSAWCCAGGPKQVQSVGVVSGGAGGEVLLAARSGVDTFISGEAPHHAFTLAEERGINLILGGHYVTETFGVKALAGRLAATFGVPWEFIDHPSGL